MSVCTCKPSRIGERCGSAHGCELHDPQLIDYGPVVLELTVKDITELTVLLKRCRANLNKWSEIALKDQKEARLLIEAIDEQLLKL